MLSFHGEQAIVLPTSIINTERSVLALSLSSWFTSHTTSCCRNATEYSKPAKRFHGLRFGFALALSLCSSSSASFAIAAPTRPKPATKPKPASKPAALKKTAAPQISPIDPNRFLKVKEWEGTFAVTSKSVGSEKGKLESKVWDASTVIAGTFRVRYYHDPRDGDRFTWQGTGKAKVVIDAKRTTFDYKGRPMRETYNGQYTDDITASLYDYDPVKGILKVSMRIPLWMEQPHKGKVLHYVRVENGETYTDTRAGYAWAADGGAGFGAPMSLPKSGFTLTGSKTNPGANIFGHSGEWKSSWTIRPVGEGFDEPLKADAGGPYKVVRGDTALLDASKSTGKIRSYKWSFAPADAKGIPFSGAGLKEGVRPTTVLLSPVKVTLTVSDGKNTDTATAVVNVVPRDYHTSFLHREKELLHPASIPPRMIKGRDLRYAGGENVCALDEYSAKNSVHILHPANTGGTWEGGGYILKQVQDAGGPFDGTWFIAEYLLKVERQTLINKYTLPGGPPPVRTAQPFYESNKKLGNDVDGYLAAVRKHEMLHTQLMEKALKPNDPAPKLEPLAGTDKDGLKKVADETIQKAEDAIDEASKDPLPSVGWKGKIAFPDDATDQYVSMDMEM